MTNRLIKFLIEQEGGMVSGNTGGEGYETIPDSGPATTTKNVSKFYNKIGEPARRKPKKKRKKFTTYIDINDNIIQDICELHNKLNESVIPDVLFNNLKSVASKVGFKVKQSDSIWDYISSAEIEIQEIFNLLCLYVLADKENKSSLKSDIKAAIKKVNTKRFTAFVLMLDKMSFGLTSILRHILMAVFGIEITTYNKWDSDITYILAHLDKIKKVLMRMNPTEEEIRALDKLYRVITDTKEEIERNKGINYLNKI